jgi:hypothetical protein
MNVSRDEGHQLLNVKLCYAASNQFLNDRLIFQVSVLVHQVHGLHYQFPFLNSPHGKLPPPSIL